MRSFEHDARATVVGPQGQRVHRDHLAHREVIERRFYAVRPGVWTLVGNGLSNQTFIEAPDGIIAIDTGESVQEMEAALAELREHTQRPVVAVIYTHFHYVEGTKAVLAEPGNASPMPIYAHERVTANKSRTSGEIAPVYARGLVEQFGITLPIEGPDALLHVGLGLFYRNPEHAPFTSGFVPPTVTFGPATTLTIGGLRVEITPAPSDADDSVTLWFPELATCVHNIVWPTLFNIFAIRGDEYRDPRVLLTGIDHVRALGAEHLVATHGPPMSGAADIARRTVRYRDSIQFLWDQTVRGINKGWTTDELASRVRLPALYDDDFLTSERYGVGEHHVRQIHNGLRGWFDGAEARLFPLEPTERFGRLIAGFGGRATVREQAQAALAADDVRWALELATWLVRAEGAEADDRVLLATALRTVAERTSAANIRNWCLAHARDLDGSAPMDRFRVHRFTSRQLEGATAASIVHTLRVLLDPDRAEGIDHHLAFAVEGEATAGLHVRNGVAVPTDGAGAQSTISLDRATFVGLLTGRVRWSDARAAGTVAVQGDAAGADRVVACFEVPGFQS